MKKNPKITSILRELSHRKLLKQLSAFPFYQLVTLSKISHNLFQHQREISVN